MSFALSEKASARSNALLSSRIAESLSHLVDARALPNEDERLVFEDGEVLLRECIAGSRLVAGERPLKDQLAPSPDSIRNLRHALSTLERLQARIQVRSVTQALDEVNKALSSAREARSVEQIEWDRVPTAIEFFRTLTTLLCEELTTVRLQEAAPKRANPETGRIAGLSPR